jgi:hypothetical protein
MMPASRSRPPLAIDQEESEMSDPFESTKPEEIAAFVGKHIIYTYENGWQYEIYVRNDRTLDYECMVAWSADAG